MWPFDDEDSTTQDFNATAQEIINYAPDAEAGLGAMRDLYRDSEFTNSSVGQQLLESRSNEVRQKFGERTPFDFDKAINVAPIMLDDIQGEGDTPDNQRIDQLNKWESQNVEAIGSIEDPIYVQNRSAYTRDVQKAAVSMRREIYGEDNYWVSDWALRAGEGAVSGVSDLVGYHGIEDYFQERTKPEWDQTLGTAVAGTAGFAGTALGIGLVTGGTGTLGYLGASGLGQVRKQYDEAKDSGATNEEALGAAAIEGASQAIQLGTGEKILGGAVEKILGKNVVKALGTQVFPRIAKNVAIGTGAGIVGSALSTEATNVGEGLDKPILTKQTLFAGLAGGVVALGASAFGEYGAVRREKTLKAKVADKPLISPLNEQIAREKADSEGPESGGSSGVGSASSEPDPIDAKAREVVEGLQARYESGSNGVFIPKHPVDAVLEQIDAHDKELTNIGRQIVAEKVSDNPNQTVLNQLEAKRKAVRERLNVYLRANELLSPENVQVEASNALKYAVEAVDGETPAPHEGSKIPARAVELDNPRILAEMADGTNLVTQDGLLHTQHRDGSYSEAHKNVFFVTPEVAAKLSGKHSHDGVGVHLTVEGDKLFADSQFLTPDLEVANSKTGTKKREVIGSKEGTVGSVPIHVNEVTHTPTEGKSLRTFKYEIGSPIVSTAGAASIKMQPTGFRGRMQDVFGQQVRAYHQRLLDTLSPERAEQLGLSVTSYEEGPDGSRTAVQHPLNLYPTFSVAEGFQQAKDFINTHGIHGTLDYLNNLDKPGKEDTYIVGEARRQLMEAQRKAENSGDYNGARDVDTLLAEVIFHEANIRGEQAAGTGAAAHIDAALAGESSVSRIRTTKRKEAEVELARELGVPRIDTQELKADIEKHADNVAAAEAAMASPIDRKISDLDAKKNLLGEKRRADKTAKIKEHKDEIKDFKNQEAKAKEEVLKRRLDQKNKIKATLDKLREEKRLADQKIKEAERTKRKANTQLIREAERLEKAIAAAEESSNKIGTKNIKADPNVREYRMLAENRNRKIRELNKERKSTELTDEQKKIQAQIDDLQKNRTDYIKGSANKEQRLRLSKSIQDKTKAEEKLSKVQQRFEDKMKEFPEEDQNKLKNLYSLLAKDKRPTHQIGINQTIFNLESKYTPLTPEGTDRIWNYWRKNVLSGTDTAVRNFLGNAGALISTPVAHLATGNVTEAGLYVKGALAGLRRGGLEGAEILAGNRRARLTLNAGEKPEPVQGFRTTSGKPLAPFNPLNYLLDVTELMHRGLGAADAVFANSAKEGQAFMAAHMLEMRKVPAERWQQSLDQALWRTEDQKKIINSQIDDLVEGRKLAGISTSEREKNLLFYEGMEANRAGIINKISERHALTNTFMQDPNRSFFGMLARGLNKAATYEIPVGKYKIRPLKEELAFLNTAANIADYWLAHTPLGVGHALEIRRNQKASIAEALEMRTKASEISAQADAFRQRGKTEKADQLDARAKTLLDEAKNAPNYHTLEMREQLGRMMVGTSAMASLYSILKYFADDENPYVRFNGLAPTGERKKWQAEGRQEFSLQIGDTVIPKEVLGPLTLGFTFADNLVKASRTGQDLRVVGVNTAIMGMGALSQLSFLRSAGDFFQMLHGGDPVDENSKGWHRVTNNIGTSAASYLQPFIPASGFLRNIYKWYDGSPQETYNNFTAKLLNNIPFGTSVSGAQPRLNMFGEPIKIDFVERTPVNLMVSSIHDDPVIKWMGATGFNVTDQGPMLALNKGERQRFGAKRDAIGVYKDTLDQQESYEVLQIAGPQIKAYLSNLVDNPAFAVANETRQRQINTVVNHIRARARFQVLSQ